MEKITDFLKGKENISYNSIRNNNEIDWLGFYPIIDNNQIIVDIIDDDNFGWMTKTTYRMSDNGLTDVYGDEWIYNEKLEAYI